MRAYNVGSEQEITIKNLALEVASCINRNAEVVIRGADSSENVNRYVPSITKMEVELGWKITVPLQDSLFRTIQWYRQSEKI